MSNMNINRKRMYDFLQSNDVLDFEKKTVKNLIRQYLNGDICNEGFNYLNNLELITNKQIQKEENELSVDLNEYIEFHKFKNENPYFFVGINTSNKYFEKELSESILGFERSSGIKCNTILMNVNTFYLLDSFHLTKKNHEIDPEDLTLSGYKFYIQDCCNNIKDNFLVCGNVITHEGKYFIHKNYFLVELNSLTI